MELFTLRNMDNFREYRRELRLFCLNIYVFESWVDLKWSQDVGFVLGDTAQVVLVSFCFVFLKCNPVSVEIQDNWIFFCLFFSFFSFSFLIFHFPLLFCTVSICMYTGVVSPNMPCFGPFAVFCLFTSINPSFSKKENHQNGVFKNQMKILRKNRRRIFLENNPLSSSART